MGLSQPVLILRVVAVGGEGVGVHFKDRRGDLIPKHGVTVHRPDVDASSAPECLVSCPAVPYNCDGLQKIGYSPIFLPGSRWVMSGGYWRCRPLLRQSSWRRCRWRS